MAASTPMEGRPPGTSTSSGPFETTSFTVSPWWRTPVAGSWEMTRPSATESEYSRVVSTPSW